MKVIKSFNIPTIIKGIQMMGKGRKLFLICVFLFCGIELAGIPLVTYGIKGVINGVTMKNYSLFYTALMLIIIKHLIWSIYAPISSYLCDYASKGAIRDVKIKTIEHMLKLPQRYHDSKQNGELLSHITNDISCLQDIYDGRFFEVIRLALQGVGGIIMMAIMDVRFAIVVFVLGTVSVYTTAYFSKKLEDTGEKLQENLSKNNIDVYELMKAIKTIRLLNLSNTKKSEFEKSTEAEGITRIKGSKISSKMNAIISGISVMTYLAILGVGAAFVYYGLSDWGTVIALSGLKMSTDCLFLECGQHMAGMQADIAGVKRLLSILNEEEEGLSKEGRFMIAKDSMPLITKDISFSYDGKTPVLKGTNVFIEPCKLTALIGESGCGKSTLMKLVLALYEPAEGNIIFNGNEEVTLEALRRKTAYVPQDPMLFSGTILQNISCGDDNASLDEVIKAAKKAEAHEFIEKLPQGYDTIILEDGKNLSGGEKQRIAIARALFKNTPILLLDEITSALDSSTEEKIMETVCNISKDRAVLMITHKADIGRYADKIYQLDGVVNYKIKAHFGGEIV